MTKGADAEARPEVPSDGREGKAGLRPVLLCGEGRWEVSSTGRCVPQAREGSGPLRGLSRTEDRPAAGESGQRPQEDRPPAGGKPGLRPERQRSLIVAREPTGCSETEVPSYVRPCGKVNPFLGGGGLRPHLSFGSRRSRRSRAALHGGPGLSGFVPEQIARAKVGGVWQCRPESAHTAVGSCRSRRNRTRPGRSICSSITGATASYL